MRGGASILAPRLCALAAYTRVCRCAAEPAHENAHKPPVAAKGASSLQERRSATLSILVAAGHSAPLPSPGRRQALADTRPRAPGSEPGGVLAGWLALLAAPGAPGAASRANHPAKTPQKGPIPGSCPSRCAAVPAPYASRITPPISRASFLTSPPVSSIVSTQLLMAPQVRGYLWANSANGCARPARPRD